MEADPFTTRYEYRLGKGSAPDYAEAIAALELHLIEKMQPKRPRREPEVSQYILEQSLMKRLNRG